jgi:hypothetical protein
VRPVNDLRFGFPAFRRCLTTDKLGFVPVGVDAGLISLVGSRHGSAEGGVRSAGGSLEQAGA